MLGNWNDIETTRVALFEDPEQKTPSQKKSICSRKQDWPGAYEGALTAHNSIFLVRTCNSHKKVWILDTSSSWYQMFVQGALLAHIDVQPLAPDFINAGEERIKSLIFKLLSFRIKVELNPKEQ